MALMHKNADGTFSEIEGPAWDVISSSLQRVGVPDGWNYRVWTTEAWMGSPP